MEYFSVRLQESYSQPQYIVHFSIYNCIAFSDPIVYVPNPGSLTSKKEEYVQRVCLCVCVFIITISAILPSY